MFSILYPISWYASTVPVKFFFFFLFLYLYIYFLYFIFSLKQQKNRKTNWVPPRQFSSRDLILFYLENSDLNLELKNFLGTNIFMLSSKSFFIFLYFIIFYILFLFNFFDIFYFNIFIFYFIFNF